VLHNQGLVAALHTRLEAVEARADVQTAIDVQGALCLTPLVEEGLYQIAREALNNTFKHAQAMDILVSLRQEEHSVCMEIRDNGVGFDLESAREHRGLGLCGIEERAAKLGGVLTIASRPGHGTCVRVEVAI
jgi:signal transduction histidine kinase